jgi:hypothetical protein
MKKIIFSTISLGTFLLVSAFYYYSSNRDTTDLTPIETANISRHVQQTNQKPIATLPVNEITINPTKQNELIKEYLSSQDLQGFIQLAKRKLDQGGGYYAFYALGNCYSIRTSLAGRTNYTAKEGGFSLENYGKRQAAFERVRNLCQNVPSTDLTLEGLKEIKKFSKNSNDLYNQIGSEFQKTDSINDARQRYDAQALLREKLIDSQDPILLKHFGTINLNTTSGQNSADFWLDGQTFSYQSPDGKLMKKAWDLVPCAFGLDCGMTHPQVAAMCFNQNLCTESLFHLTHAQFKLNGDNGQKFERMMYFYRRLVEVIRSKDISPFRPNN